MKMKFLSALIPLCAQLLYADAAVQEERIINGSPVSQSALPWIVKLTNTTTAKTFFGNSYTAVSLCSGSLIDPQWVVTAKHCVQDSLGYIKTVSNPKDLKVFYGSYDTTKQSQSSIAVSDIFYDDTNDIALVKLKSPLPIAPAKMASPSNAATLEAIGKSVYAAGWGLTNESNQNSLAAVLEGVNVPILNSASCQVGGSEICAGFVNASATTAGPCHGDSGGPLISYDESGTPWLIGVVSSGIGACGKLTVYERISSFYNDINGVMSGTTSGTSSVSPYSDIVGTNSVGWYFWVTAKGNSYLAANGSSSMAVWQFTSDRKWKPVHNTGAFDGYAAASNIFGSVTLSSDGKSITFANPLVNNAVTSELSGAQKIGWYFWLSSAGNSYLAAEGSSGVSIWQFTSDRKWKPVSNSGAFDGYPAAGAAFSSAAFSNEHRYLYIAQ